MALQLLFKALFKQRGGGGGGGGGGAHFGHNSKSLSPSLRAQCPSISSSLHCRHQPCPVFPAKPRATEPWPAPPRTLPDPLHPCLRAAAPLPCRALTQLSLPRASLCHSPVPLQPSVSYWHCRAFALVPLGQLSLGLAAFRGPIAARALHTLPCPASVSFSDYRHGPHSGWVPLEAPSQV